MRKALLLSLLVVATVASLRCAAPKTESPSALGASPPAGWDAAVTMLDGVAAIVVPNCAVVGCHDAVRKEHNMDLSTADKIYDAWVNKKGLDHCRNSLRIRVVPGSPGASYVVAKIAGVDTCELSQRMPAAPRLPLSPEQIETIRAWILAGAPLGAILPDAGLFETPDSGPQEAAPTADATKASADDVVESGCAEEDAPYIVYAPDADDPTACTASRACDAPLACVGDGCNSRWECFSHYDETMQHPCPGSTALYCGCDGVTFEALDTCPDRPYSHPGACDDGTNCDHSDLRCTLEEPRCEEGSTASVVDGRYGPCVPFASCRCEFQWECPHRDKFVCDASVKRCTGAPM